MSAEDIADFARLKYRVGILEERAGAPTPTVKLKVAVRDTIAVLQKWVREKGTCLDEDNPDYCEVCSTLPMLEEAFKAYLDVENFSHPAEAEQDRLAMFGKAVSHEEAVRDKDNLDKVCDELEQHLDDLVVIAASPGQPTGMWTYCTAISANCAFNELTDAVISWGRHKKDAKMFTRTKAAKLIEPLHKLYGRAPGSFSVQDPRSEETKTKVTVVAAESGPLAPVVAKADKVATDLKPTTFNLDGKPRKVENFMVPGSKLRELLPQDKQEYAIFIEKPEGPDEKIDEDSVVDVRGLNLYSVPSALFGSA